MFGLEAATNTTCEGTALPGGQRALSGVKCLERIDIGRFQQPLVANEDVLFQVFKHSDSKARLVLFYDCFVGFVWMAAK